MTDGGLNNARPQTCAHCGSPGRPYTHRGRQYNGLFPNQGELLCERCLDHAHHADVTAAVTAQTDGLEQARYDGPWDYRATEMAAAARLNELRDQRPKGTERRTSRTP